jgi:hypothetical protein
MLKLLQAIIKRFSRQPPDPHIERRLAWAIEQIDPRLKSFGNYPAAYLPAITAASDYAAELAASLPECLDLSLGRYTQEPLLHALFSNVESISRCVRESREIVEYWQQQGGQEGVELFALMGMRRHQKTVFGQEINGDNVQQDVQQTLVYFDDHTLSLPSVSREELRARIETDLFESLILSLRDYIAAGVRRRQELETERDILASRLRSHPTGQETLAAQLQQVQQQLQPLSREWILANYHQHFAEFMRQPHQHLRLERCDILIDMRGVMRDSEERLAGNFIFYDLVGRDRRVWTLCPLRLPLAELQPALQDGCNKERWMEI